MKTLKTIFVTIVLLAILLPIAGLAFIYSGVYNIAATQPHNPVTAWLIGATVHRSIEVQSQGLEAPALNDPQLIQTGFEHYREDCAGCHTAPGASVSEFAQGFYPEAPDLAEEAEEMTSEQLFWVIKHGIKMTAMPAWGPTHDNGEIWAIVAFIKQLPNLSDADYQRLENAALIEQTPPPDILSPNPPPADTSEPVGDLSQGGNSLTGNDYSAPK